MADAKGEDVLQVGNCKTGNSHASASRSENEDTQTYSIRLLTILQK